MTPPVACCSCVGGTRSTERTSGSRREGGIEPGETPLAAAEFTGERPAPARTGLLPDEQASLDTYAWTAWPDLGSFADPVEPPQLSAVLGALVPDGPWS
ncbi:hypothetical protein ACGH52_32160 [Streptomyces sp. BBFR25]|uniref:hypothetical protein n=1 Tax=unclassified Streptomyces TaxID=2593676 RepID=UPI001EE959CD|nr:hypothetical protein [Streptomyces sp. E5N298]